MWIEPFDCAASSSVQEPTSLETHLHGLVQLSVPSLPSADSPVATHLAESELSDQIDSGTFQFRVHPCVARKGNRTSLQLGMAGLRKWAA